MKGTIECEAARVNGKFDGVFVSSHSLHVSCVFFFVTLALPSPCPLPPPAPASCRIYSSRVTANERTYGAPCYPYAVTLSCFAIGKTIPPAPRPSFDRCPMCVSCGALVCDGLFLHVESTYRAYQLAKENASVSREDTNDCVLIRKRYNRESAKETRLH